MKKTIYAIAMMLITSVASFAQAEDAKVILQSGANTTIYDGNSLSTAIGAAKKGDIIYLSEGIYSGFTIDKEILVRGVGEKSYVNGDITIAIPDNPTLTTHIIEGVWASGALNITKPATDMIIRSCKFSGDLNVSAALPNGLIDRCFIDGTVILNTYTNTVTIKNSKVRYILGASASNNQCFFKNCNVWDHKDYYKEETTAAKFENCILASNDEWHYSEMTRCLMRSNYIKETTITTNCYKENSGGSTFLDETSLEAKYDLASKDYLGTDGTIIGVYGGTTPFTLDPQVAKVTESSFTVDTTTKKLTVKLKVAAQ